ncbi:carboxypeptidase regulatory-like domain-containing protein [uncultured Arcticibacterium sp.]|uniref:carboxypeptidase regulatory-like domain-containing protein n=1 Tax=uncultured Arcticibacterium sp. TaxID=2173042 RepID=UPI0030F7FEFA
MIARIKKTTLLVMLGLVVTMSAIAQQSLLKMAEHHYDNLSFVKAIEAYEQALTKKGIDPENAKLARIKLADSYCKLKDNANAERVFNELFNGDADVNADPVVYLKYAQVLASNGKYQESQNIYNIYNDKASNDPRGEEFSKLYSDVSVLSKNADCYNVDYLSINTTASDFSPSYFRNGLVFVSNRQNTAGVSRVFQWSETPFLDLFFLEDLAALGGSSSAAGLGGSSSEETSSSKTKKKKGVGLVGSDEYTAPTANDSETLGSFGRGISLGHGYGDSPETDSERFDGDINSKYHEGPSAFFKDGQRVIFTRNNFVKGKAEKSSDGINKLKLYIANADKNSWTDIAELPFNSSEYSTGHPTLSPEEDYLFFASDMPGGFGGTDIYAAKIDNGNWSQPINLGPQINTKGNEMFPYIDENGDLYFSSEGLPGLGGLDIFFVKLNATEALTTPENLGTPINSSQDDFGMLTDGLRKSGYFSSNRKRGGDDDDIYKFERECELQQNCDLIIAAYDAETKMPLDNVVIEYTDAKGNIQEGITNEDGSLTLENLDSNTEFTFSASRDGYNPNIISLTTDECDGEPTRLEIPMTTPTDKDALAGNNSGQSGGLQGPESGLSESGFSNNTSCTIRGRVLMQNTSNPVDGVLVTLRNECDGSTQTAYTDDSGYYEFIVAEGCDYTLSGTKADLASHGKTVSKLSCANGGVTADIMMFGSGDIVAIENIYFNYGKCDIRADAREGIDKLVKLMREYPGMKIELSSHTDSRSPKAFNQKLSEGRAKESAEYLFKRGVSRNRVTYAGYGESRITNGCVDGVKCSEAQHQANRRTEFEIIQMQ